ncbi:acetolactate synthase small subunit [Neptunitalea lumnitzerae]|uniref:Acetolactate synthase small subunit n=1 Tax=Neptunitalea lumnitzerae TaxID=2965509 RepID=A0ABQ5MK42_9FLAO|nr:acetolactate synthase small subunit [Neptunitalea sp. Y10]GLB49785.1 acetolactate synthase small subunit [Neptunitalea sp. Y10]
MEEKFYTITVYTENSVGLLNRVSGIFLKRHINIESINASVSEIQGVHKYVVLVKTTEDWVRKITGQLEKQVEVIKAFYHTDDEIIYQESALFKIKSDLLFDERQIQNIIKDSNSQIVTVSRNFFVIAKTGRRHEIEELYDELEPYGIMQFVRSGRISVSKESMEISNILKEFQEN